MIPRILRHVLVAGAAAVSFIPGRAQTAPAADKSAVAPAPDVAIELSPFEVSVERDVGYVATNSLAGSRLNTELFNTPAAISVFTKEFLSDIGALTTEEVLNYTLNGSRSFPEYTGLTSVQQADLIMQARGFSGAALTRDYFTVQYRSDAFNIERIDLSRGPNSILFGIGGAGGALNTSTKRARFGKEFNELQFRVGSWDDYRGTIDVSRQIGRKVALRVNGVWQDRNSWRDFEFLEQKGAALSLVARPWIGGEMRVQAEYLDRDQLVAQPWPVADYLTPWLDAGRPIAPTGTSVVAGTAANTARAYVFDNTSALGPISWFGTRMTARTTASPTLGGNATTLTRFDLVPRSASVSGPGATTDNWTTSTLAVFEQRLGDLAFELAYNHQENHRDIHFTAEWSDVGVYADPNALLPNGQPNPNVGRMYVESNANWRVIDQRSDAFRATASYTLDLRQRNRWLGRHQFAAFAMTDEVNFLSDALREVNITPAGSATYPVDLSSANNRIRRRTYLDFSSPDLALHGAHDPWENPIVNVNGVTSGWRRAQAAGSINETITDTTMIAGQSQLLLDRLNVTWGLRHDKQSVLSNSSATPPRDPVTREFLISPMPDEAVVNSGNTRTYGLVYSLTPWLALYYNNANNFAPQSDLDINGRPIGPREGKGKDFGLKLRLWDGKIHATIGGYKTSEQNRVLNDTRSQTSLLPTINEIWEAMGMPERYPETSWRDTVTNDGDGWEAELTANPTRQWRVSLNASIAHIAQTDTFPRYAAYIEANRALWQKNAVLPLITPIGGGAGGTNPTVATAIAHIDATYAGMRQSEGQVPRFHRERSVNLFTSYTFASGPQWLRGLTLGGGANYRSEAVAGYDATRNLAPLFSPGFTIVNAMASRSFKISGKYTLKLQFNVDNVFDHDDLIVTDRDEKAVYRHLYNLQLRKWSLATTLSF